MNHFSIFVSSSDNYADIWDVFFFLFKKNWPEYKGKIYLQTQDLDYSYEGLNIICTKVGKKKYFGETLRAGLDKVEEEYILFIMIDYIFMEKVNHFKVMEYFKTFISEKADSLRLIEENFEHSQSTKNSDIKKCLPPARYRFFSYQIAFWKKTMLKEMALPHETPWSSEYYGDQRAHLIPINLLSVVNNTLSPIKYDPRGCLHRGKWLSNAIEYLTSINYPMNYKQRGIYQEDYQKRETKLKISYMIKRDGIKGSYLQTIRLKLKKLGL